ncbi:polysaccharide deacetylase family protein, partial [Kibdelosporangium lantanae]
MSTDDDRPTDPGGYPGVYSSGGQSYSGGSHRLNEPDNSGLGFYDDDSGYDSSSTTVLSRPASDDLDHDRDAQPVRRGYTWPTLVNMGDVIPARDACPYGWSPDQTVFGSGVRNPQKADGCTLLDAIWDHAPFRSHASFVSTVVTSMAGFGLTPVEKGRVLVAALGSDVGTRPEVDNSCANRIALTFDDGTSIYRPRLLQVLRDKQVHATFFDNGVRVEANPQWARFQAREGHVELNHTYSHVHMDQLTPEQNREEVVHNERVLAAAGAPITFRGIRP